MAIEALRLAQAGDTHPTEMLYCLSKIYIFSPQVDSNQRNYGVAVTDVDQDGNFEIFVAGFSGPNLVLKYNEHTATLENMAQLGTPFEELMDFKGQAIGSIFSLKMRTCKFGTYKR